MERPQSSMLLGLVSSVWCFYALRTLIRAYHSNALIPVKCCPSTKVCTSFVPSYVYTDSRLHICRMIGYSPVIPFAPKIPRDVRAHSNAIATLFIFAIDTC